MKLICRKNFKFIVYPKPFLTFFKSLITAVQAVETAPEKIILVENSNKHLLSLGFITDFKDHIRGSNTYIYSSSILLLNFKLGLKIASFIIN